jgi:hypothetical protein
MPAMKFPLLVFCGLFLLGCSTLTTHQEPGLASVKRIYVEHLLTDNHRIDQLIVAELTGLGYEASYGPLTMMPEGVDAILTYRERSSWDFKNYLIELGFELKANFTGKVLATGRYYQPSMMPKPPKDVIHTVLTPVFKRS